MSDRSSRCERGQCPGLQGMKAEHRQGPHDHVRCSVRSGEGLSQNRGEGGGGMEVRGAQE